MRRLTTNPRGQLRTRSSPDPGTRFPRMIREAEINSSTDTVDPRERRQNSDEIEPAATRIGTPAHRHHKRAALLPQQRNAERAVNEDALITPDSQCHVDSR